jgi:hypothetical protein
MTSYERAIWTGDPLTASDFGYSGAVNLLPSRVFYSEGVTVIFRNDHFAVSGAGYAVIVIGAASDFAGADITLSADRITGTGGSLELGWYDSDDTFESIDRVELSSGGVTTVRLDTNTGTWQFLALRITTSGGITAFNKVMLERGDTRHDYVPYTPVLPTEATKGAYNYSDLNRVEMAVEELSEQLGLRLTTKTDWTIWDVPTESDMNRYRDNLVMIEQHFRMEEVMGDIPPDLSKLTYTHANMIEQFLLSVSAMTVISEV